MFRRRIELHPIQRIREFLWPRAGWKRAFQYGWRRVWRLSGTPHAIAVGVAAGVFASCTPFVGFHFVIGFALAWVCRGNLIAAAFGTFFGNPLTFPLIWISSYDLGVWILGGMDTAVMRPADMSLDFFLGQGVDVIWPIIKPMVVGGAPLGLFFALSSYLPVRGAVEAYQKRRRARLAARALTNSSINWAADGDSK